MSEFERVKRLASAYLNREMDRIKGLERRDALDELDGPAPTIPASNRPPAPVVVDADMARRYLGVDEAASFEVVRAKYEELVRRSNPNQFEEGTADHSKAMALQRRIHHAYSILSEEVSVTEKRFKSLEID